MTISRQQLGFVENYVLNGGVGTAAAVAAGYSSKTAHVQASRLLKRRDIKTLVHERTIELASAAVPLALDTLVKIMRDPQAQRRERLLAAKEILDRGGLPKQSSHQHGVQVSVAAVNPVDIIREVSAMRAQRTANSDQEKFSSDTSN